MNTGQRGYRDAQPVYSQALTPPAAADSVMEPRTGWSR